jgi:hypothetical protein
MDQYSMEFQFKKITTIYGSHIDHIWTNVPIQQCMSRFVEAYWIDHKPIYCAFKLPDYISQYHHIGKKKCSFKNIHNNKKEKVMMKG